MARNMIEVTTVRESNVVSGGGVSPITSASHANAGATADAARYLFSFETERSVNAAELAVLSQKEANRGTVTEAELALNAFKGVLLDLCEQYGAVTISTPFGTFETRCAGSADNAFTLPAEGSVYLDFTFSDAQRREFARIEARVPADEAPARLVIRVRNRRLSHAVPARHFRVARGLCVFAQARVCCGCRKRASARHSPADDQCAFAPWRAFGCAAAEVAPGVWHRRQVVDEPFRHSSFDRGSRFRA